MTIEIEKALLHYIRNTGAGADPGGGDSRGSGPTPLPLHKEGKNVGVCSRMHHALVLKVTQQAA